MNHDLGDTLGNLAARVVKFAGSHWGWSAPSARLDVPADLEAELDGLLAELREVHRKGASRRAAEATRAVCRLANRRFAEARPWETFKTDPARAAAQVAEALDLLRLSAAAAWPFVPDLAERLLAALGDTDVPPELPERGRDTFGAVPAGGTLSDPGRPFPKFDGEWVAAQKARFGGADGWSGVSGVCH